MDWLHVTAGILVTVTLAVLLGWTETKVKSTAAKVFLWSGAILALLVIRFFDGQPFVFIALALAAILDITQHIPPWITRTAGWLVVVFVGRYFLVLLVGCFTDIGTEIQKTNARITLMESSIMAKLDDISGRLPDQD